MKKRTIRNILLCISIPAVLLAAAYLLVSGFYMNHFYNGTWINGINFSNKTVEEAIESLVEYKESYTLRLTEYDGDQEVIAGADIGYAATFDLIKEIKEEQGMWNWISWGMNINFYTVEGSITYDEEKLKAVIHQLKCVSGSDVVQPQDAYVEFDENGVNLVPEVAGTAIDESKLLIVVKEALDNQERRLDITNLDCYIQPAITTQSREIQAIMAPIQKIIDTSVTYTFGSSTEVLDSSTTKTWIVKEEEGTFSINADKVREYVQSLADKYNTWGNSRTFKSTNQGYVTVGGGNYGWSIDVDKETDALLEILEAGESVTREPEYSSTAIQHGDDEIGGTYLEISISEQHMWYYVDYQLVVDTNIVTGNESKSHGTPKGSYKVLTKYTNIILKGTEFDGVTEYESPVSYWIGFKGSGYGVHDASWRGTSQGGYGGNIYYYSGSHGCVNTPYPKVQEIYNLISYGTPVLVY